MGQLGTRVLALAFGILLCVSTAVPVRADADAGLGVEGAMAEITARPGQLVSHTMRISLGPEATGPLHVSVEARGLGETLDGATLALDADDDSSPFSARELITSVEPDSFTLAPGSSEVVIARIAVPAQLTSGIRYADLYINTDSASPATANIGTRVAIHVPVLLTIANSTFKELASITDLDVDAPAPNQPVVVTTVAENEGNHHFRAENQVTVFGPDDSAQATSTVPLTGSSLLPRAKHAYRASLDPLPAGRYEVVTKIVATNGEVLAQRHANFRVGQAQEGSGESGGSASHHPVPTAVLPRESGTTNVESVPELVAASAPSKVSPTPTVIETPPAETPAVEAPSRTPAAGATTQPPTGSEEGATPERASTSPTEAEARSSRAAPGAVGAVVRTGQAPETVTVAEPVTPQAAPVVKIPSPTIALPPASTPEVAGAQSASGTYGPLSTDSGLFVSWAALGGILAGLVSGGLALYMLLPVWRKRDLADPGAQRG